MPHQTIIEYPRYVSIPEAIEIAKKLVNNFKGGITKEALATLLQHKNISSGTFLVKLSDLKKYGIIEGRGDSFYTTDIAKKIAIPLEPKERDIAVVEMINNIKIIPQLYEVFHSDIAPSENELLIQLITITRKERDEIQPLVADISKLYKDALPYISMVSRTTSQQMVQLSRDASSTATNDNIDISVTAPLTINDEGIYLKITKDIEHLNLAKELIDIYIKKLEKTKDKAK